MTLPAIPALANADHRLLQAVAQLPGYALLHRVPEGLLALGEDGPAFSWTSYRNLHRHRLIAVASNIVRGGHGMRLDIHVAPNEAGRDLAATSAPLPRPLNAPEQQLLRAIAALDAPTAIDRPLRSVLDLGPGGHRARCCVWYGLEQLGLIRIERTFQGPASVIATDRGRHIAGGVSRAAKRRRHAS